MWSYLRNAGNLLLQPLFPMSKRNRTPRDGQIASKMFLSHSVGALIIFFAVFSEDKAILYRMFITKWSMLTVCISVGFLAAISLLVYSCRQRSRVILCAKDDDPSINLQLVFLWVFALSMMISLSVNIIIYMRCALYESEDFAHSVFLVLVFISYILFTVLQTVLLTYNKRSVLKNTIHLHLSVVFILIANFSLWYSSTVHTILAKGNKTAGFQNKSCFHSSEIQKKLGSKITVILFPPELEFYVLASTLLISLWQNSTRILNSETSAMEGVLSSDYDGEHSQQISMRVNGKQILALTVGILINIPIVISVVLLDFVFEWQSINVKISMDIFETFSSLCSCVLICMCCYRMKSISTFSRRPFLIREYILILSSTGIVAFFMIEIVANLTRYSLSKTTTLSRVFGILETYLQTYLLLNSSRRMSRECREGSPIISFSAIILVISNFTYWLLDSYNRHILTKARYANQTKWDSMEIFLFPVVTFYRFFAGMSAYSMYKIFKPHG